MKPRGVPVVMYHGVGPDRPGWVWSRLITPLDVFEGQMRILKEKGWNTISLKRLFDHMAENSELPDKPVVLTFDDGYLDNWVYAYPVLKKYGHHAVIWVSTDFVDPRSGLRPNLEDLWERRIGRKDLENLGYLSWDEMRKMIGSGHVEIQSHAMTHTWYFSGPEIVDFHRPRGSDGYVPPPWLGWNMFPGRKYEYMSAGLEDGVPYGTPIYRNEKALVCRRYFEDEDLKRRLIEHVRDGGGPSFFDRKGWRKELKRVVKENPPESDRFETEEEYMARVRGELSGSRRIIEDALGTDVEFLCWPGGGRSPMALGVAEEVGYLASTTHYLDSWRRNVFGQDPREINRIGNGSPWIWRGRIIRRIDPEFFISILEQFMGIQKSVWTSRRYKLKYLLRYYLLGIK